MRSQVARIRRMRKFKAHKMNKLTLTTGKNLSLQERTEVYWMTASAAKGRVAVEATVEGIIHNFNAIRFNNNPANLLSKRTNAALMDVIENGVNKRRKKKSQGPSNVVFLEKRASA